MRECPNCERFYRGDLCPLCGFSPKQIEEPSPPVPPKDNSRWMCRARPENGLPCSIEGCDHPGSQRGEVPNREMVQSLVADLVKKMTS